MGFANAVTSKADGRPPFYRDAREVLDVLRPDAPLDDLVDGDGDFEELLIERMGAVGDDWDDPLLDAALDMAHDEQERYWDDLWD